MRKRALCALLALILSLSLLPGSASAAGGVKINKTNFPDAGFRSFIKQNCDTDGNGTLSTKEIKNVSSIFATEFGFTSLKGIEFFTELEYLKCNTNELKALDVSKNTKLKELSCGANKLTSLDVSKNTKLVYLYCNDNLLKTLDVTKNKKLQTLCCYNNRLTKLDISKNTRLKDLECDGNSIKTLDISNNPILIQTYLMGSEATYSSEYITYYYGEDCYIYADYDTAITGYKPTITAQPKNAYVSAGNAATFSVTAKGECMTYQWYIMWDDDTDWHPIIGGTDSTLEFPTSPEYMVGAKVYCQITVEGARELIIVKSESASLFYQKRPAITTQPKNASAAAGKSVTFKLKATGGGLKYQWYVQKKGTTKWTKLSGKTSATLKLTVKKDMNGYKYRCEVKNDIAKIYSKTVKLTVK